MSSCDEAMTKLFSKHELLFDLATKTEDPSLVKDDLETWLSEVTTQNDTILKKAREFIDLTSECRWSISTVEDSPFKKQATKQNIKCKNVTTVENI